MEENAAAFWETVVPDVDQEVDRICMILLEVCLRHWAMDKSSYAGNVTDARRELYPPPSGEWDNAAPAPAFYPAQHLCYWFEVRADHWATSKPSSGDPGADTITVLNTLLETAKHIQKAIDDRSQMVQVRLSKMEQSKGGLLGQQQDQGSADLLEMQKESVAAVLRMGEKLASSLRPAAKRTSNRP